MDARFRNLILSFGVLALLAGAAALAARREAVSRTLGIPLQRVACMDHSLAFAGTPEAVAEELPSPPPPPPPLAEGRSGPRPLQEGGPRLIRRAELELEVRDFPAFEARMRELAAKFGYLASAEVEVQEDGRRRAHLELKAEAARFEAALSAFKALGTVRKESQSVEDASLNWVDLEARASAKRMAIQRLRELLQQRTGKLSEVVTAEKALAEMTESLDSLEARRRVLGDQVAYASLQAEVFEPGARNEPEGLRARLKALGGEALSALLRSLGWMAGGFLMLLPWLLLGGLLWRFRRRRTRRNED